MGRQLAIVATEQDELEFLAFLRSTARIELFESFAPTVGELRVECFASERAGHFHYQIWNSSFPWTPEYGQTKKGNLHYVSNLGAAPILEFSRSGPGQKPGRIYWAKYFSAPNGLSYDVERFEAWFNRIVRWVRKVGVRTKMGRLGAEAYFLPDARRQLIPRGQIE
jgi:hypothetical protein